MRCPRALLMCLWLAQLLCHAGSPWTPPVGRATSDRDADLIDALIRASRFGDALEICQSRLRGADAQSDAAAKWVIRQSLILTARQLAGDRFDDSDLQAVQKPTSDFLNSYPAHRRRLFLEAQNVRTEREAAFHSVLRAAVSPGGDASRELASDQLVRATAQIVTLSDRVDDARSQLDSNQRTRELGLIADLVRLQQELQVDAVALALMQTELFPRGSDDCIAAATKAEQAASDAMARLPADTAARREVERLKVEAIFRAEQLRRADGELSELVRRFSEPISARVQALQVRLDIAGGRMEQAEARLVSYYGNSPDSAAPSVEMDLARLEFLLLSDRADGVGIWLDVIARRGGAYARRRAEAMSIQHLGTSHGAADAPSIDPSIVAAQGQDWLRRGDPGRAGELLSAAAAAQSDPDRAIERAGQAAAAWISANRSPDAAQVLANVALAKPTGAGAAAAHLQATFMISSQPDTDAGDQVETMLRANLRQWQSSSVSDAARSWLQKLLAAQNRDIEAAEVATGVLTDRITVDDLESIVDRWLAGFQETEQDSLADASNRFQSSFRPFLQNDVVRRYYRLAAAILLDRDALAGLPAPASDGSDVTFADALLEFRQHTTVSEVLRQPPPKYVADAIWRLMRDGRTYPQLRAPIADLVAQWPGHGQRSLEQAERLLWKGQTEPSVMMLRELIDESKHPAETTKRAANLLGSAGGPPSRRAAIKMWDSLASGTRQGSPLWHQAKLAVIELLQQAGEKEEAQRRAKYILLTNPAVDENLQRQYQAIVQ